MTRLTFDLSQIESEPLEALATAALRMAQGPELATRPLWADLGERLDGEVRRRREPSSTEEAPVLELATEDVPTDDLVQVVEWTVQVMDRVRGLPHATGFLHTLAVALNDTVQARARRIGGEVH